MDEEMKQLEEAKLLSYQSYPQRSIPSYSQPSYNGPLKADYFTGFQDSGDEEYYEDEYDQGEMIEEELKEDVNNQHSKAKQASKQGGGDGSSSSRGADWIQTTKRSKKDAISEKKEKAVSIIEANGKQLKLEVVKPENKEDIKLQKLYERILKTLTAIGNHIEINKVMETDGFRANVASQYEHIFSCKICLDTFDNQTRKPLVLNCGHTFCQECITKSL